MRAFIDLFHKEEPIEDVQPPDSECYDAITRDNRGR